MATLPPSIEPEIGDKTPSVTPVVEGTPSVEPVVEGTPSVEPVVEGGEKNPSVEPEEGPKKPDDDGKKKNSDLSYMDHIIGDIQDIGKAIADAIVNAFIHAWNTVRFYNKWGKEAEEDINLTVSKKGQEETASATDMTVGVKKPGQTESLVEPSAPSEAQLASGGRSKSMTFSEQRTGESSDFPVSGADSSHDSTAIARPSAKKQEPPRI
jgi:hypothetical protein